MQIKEAGATIYTHSCNSCILAGIDYINQFFHNQSCMEFMLLNTPKCFNKYQFCFMQL